VPPLVLARSPPRKCSSRSARSNAQRSASKLWHRYRNQPSRPP
jgi:hypothetical protein